MEGGGHLAAWCPISFNGSSRHKVIQTAYPFLARCGMQPEPLSISQFASLEAKFGHAAVHLVNFTL